MINITVKWTENSVKMREEFKISYDDYMMIFKQIDDNEEPLWLEFEFFLLEWFWRENIGRVKSSKVYYNNRLKPKTKTCEGIELKHFFLQVFRDSKLEILGV